MQCSHEVLSLDEADFTGLGNENEEVQEMLGSALDENEVPLAANNNDVPLGTRTRQPPSYLRDYYCHSARDASSHKSREPLCSSGKSYPIANYVHYNHFSATHQAFMAAISTNDEPKYYSQAVKHAAWREAMAQEIAALETNRTWTLEPLPEGKKLVGCRWVYHVKYKPNGEVDKYKARLVAKGYT